MKRHTSSNNLGSSSALLAPGLASSLGLLGRALTIILLVITTGLSSRLALLARSSLLGLLGLFALSTLTTWSCATVGDELLVLAESSVGDGLEGCELGLVLWVVGCVGSFPVGGLNP